jgi:low affinity Fe/Cu permease
LGNTDLDVQCYDRPTEGRGEGMMDTPLGINGLKREKSESKKPDHCKTRMRGKENSSPKKKSEPCSKSRPAAEFFTKFCTLAARQAGSYYAFCLAFAVIIAWIISGPLFQFSDTWQLVINTGTTIVTFLMVFLIQNTQNRDSQALHLKLDALLLTSPHAKNVLVDLEELSQEDLDELKARLVELVGDVQEAKQELQNGIITGEEATLSVGEPQSTPPKKPFAEPKIRECG